MRRYKLKLQLLSPIHIGNGEEISPFEYVLKGDVFYRVDLARFLSNLTTSQRSEFDKATRSGNILAMRDFVRNNCDLDKYALYTNMAQDSFIDAYNENIRNSRNQLLVDMLVRSGSDYSPYIPGSSIKGAIRTAIVSKYGESMHYLKKDKNIEKNTQSSHKCVSSLSKGF